MNLKKKVISTTIFLLLFIAAYIFVFKDYSITEFKNTLGNCNRAYLILAIGCVILWVFFESLFFKFIFKKMNYKISWFQAIGYVFTETYFSAITPSSTGGQPVQMVEMNKDKIPYRISSIVILINTLLYKVAILLIVIIGFVIYYKEINILTPTFKMCAIIGFAITSFLVVLVLCLMFSKEFIVKLVNFAYRILWKLKIKTKTKESEQKLNNSIKEYHHAANYIKNDKKVMIVSFIIILLQRLSMFSVYYFIYKSFSIKDISLLFAITIQAFLTIATDFIPIPGAVIISEALLVETNEVLGITSIAKGATLIFRNISFYLLVMIALAYYLLFRITKRNPAVKIEKEVEET